MDPLGVPGTVAKIYTLTGNNYSASAKSQLIGQPWKGFRSSFCFSPKLDPINATGNLLCHFGCSLR